MKVGTKSVIGGAHCFLLHPFFVAWGWTRLFGFPRDPRLWFAFALHDVGYVGCGDMDGPERRGACRAWSANHGFAVRTGVGGRVPPAFPILEPPHGLAHQPALPCGQDGVCAHARMAVSAHDLNGPGSCVNT